MSPATPLSKVSSDWRLRNLAAFLDSIEPVGAARIVRFWGKRRKALKNADLIESLERGTPTRELRRVAEENIADFFTEAMVPMWREGYEGALDAESPPEDINRFVSERMAQIEAKVRRDHTEALFFSIMGAKRIFRKPEAKHVRLVYGLPSRDVVAVYKYSQAMEKMAKASPRLPDDDSSDTALNSSGYPLPEEPPFGIPDEGRTYLTRIEEKRLRGRDYQRMYRAEERARKVAMRTALTASSMEYPLAFHAAHQDEALRMILAVSAYGRGIRAVEQVYQIWNSERDSRTCQACLSLDGQEVLISENFGDAPGSTEVRDVYGIDQIYRPPMHSACRCSLSYLSLNTGEELNMPTTDYLSGMSAEEARIKPGPARGLAPGASPMDDLSDLDDLPF